MQQSPDHGKAFEAYLDSIAPEDAVDEMTTDFLHRYHSCYQTKEEAIGILMGSHYLENHNLEELWEHIEAIYAVVHYADGQIYLFTPDTGGRYG